jgi:hypothetical protein
LAYKRWYDCDAKLSTMVRAMEVMNLPSQRYFAQTLLELSEMLLAERGGETYLRALEEGKKAGLEKSKAKNRWYDRYETLHRAFNNLYTLKSEDRREIAIRLSTPISIVAGYERQCRKTGQEPDVKVVEEILRTALSQGHERARRLYSLYLTDFEEELNNSSRRKSGKTESKGFWTQFLETLQGVVNPT